MVYGWRETSNEMTGCVFRLFNRFANIGNKETCYGNDKWRSSGRQIFKRGREG
jgi:hypothetical protein